MLRVGSFFWIQLNPVFREGDLFRFSFTHSLKPTERFQHFVSVARPLFSKVNFISPDTLQLFGVGLHDFLMLYYPSFFDVGILLNCRDKDLFDVRFLALYAASGLFFTVE